MRLRLITLLVLIALLMVPLAGCQSGDDDEGGTNASQEAGVEDRTDEDAETESDVEDEPEVEGDTESGTGDDEPITADLDTLDSYRQTMTTRTTSGDETTEWTIVTEYVRDPLATRSLWTSVDAEGTPDSWETVRIGDVTYMRGSQGADGSDEWVSYTSDDMEEPENSADLSNWMSAADYLDDPACQRGREDAVDGHPAILYVCDKGVFTGPAGIWGVTGELTDGGIETWVSKELDVTVKTVTWWEGEDDEGLRHEYYTEGVITDMNQPITIEAPAGAEAPGLPEDVPLMPGATMTLAMAGVVGFEVEAALDDVLAFYRDEMDSQGWSLETEAGEMLSFSKDGRAATIMLAAEDDSVSGTVIISEQ